MFTFKNKFIHEIHNEIKGSIGKEVISNKGEKWKIIKVSVLHHFERPFTNFSDPKPLIDSTIDPDSVTSYHKMYGFLVILQRKSKSGLHTEQTEEYIGIPLEIKNDKCTVSVEGSESILSNVE